MLSDIAFRSIGLGKEISMYECFHCLQRAVIWDSDFDFSDMGYEGSGVVHICHCTNCGAEIEYKVGGDEPEEIEEKKED